MAQAAEVARARAQAREAARVAPEVAKDKEVRGLFAGPAGKVKDVLHPPTLVMAILYLVVIGYTLQVKWWHSFLAHPGPSGPKADGDAPNQWVTSFRTICSFITYSAVHTCLLALMRNGRPRAVKLFSLDSLAPFVFLSVGIAYFFNYVTLASWYGTHQADWAIMGGFSIALFMTTLFVLRAPELPPVVQQGENSN